MIDREDYDYELLDVFPEEKHYNGYFFGNNSRELGNNFHIPNYTATGYNSFATGYNSSFVGSNSFILSETSKKRYEKILREMRSRQERDERMLDQWLEDYE
tara:strand:- start:5533 stop:5835 length:303 start_codon:yes stop_codon:yes gene_type:complete